MTTSITLVAPPELFNSVSDPHLALEQGTETVLARVQRQDRQQIQFDVALGTDAYAYIADRTGQSYSNKVRVPQVSARCIQVSGYGEHAVRLASCGGEPGAIGSQGSSPYSKEVAGIAEELCTTVIFTDGSRYRSCQAITPADGFAQDDGEYTTPQESLFKRKENKIRF